MPLLKLKILNFNILETKTRDLSNFLIFSNITSISNI